MFDRLTRRLHSIRRRPSARDPLTTEQLEARERWQRRWNLPILLAAIIPLVATSPDSRAVQIIVGFGSWIIFVVDLWMQRRIVPDYLHRRNGRIDLTIVVLTFPWYLVPGLSTYTAILMLARLARVARVLIATAGLRRFFSRLGTVVVFAGIMVVTGALVAYGAEHPQNPEFATFGDAMWWGIVTLTTVGYGDVVPTTSVGRLAGIAIMFTGVATIGILAGSLASLFRLGDQAQEPGAGPAGARSMQAELEELRTELQAVDRRLGERAARAERA